jgi:LysM repeat protein
MYFPPHLKRRCLTWVAAGSGLAAAFFLTGCATTKNKTAGGTDEALYLFDDGTGDLPAVENYAGNDSGAELNFTESEQVKPSRHTAGQTKPSRSSGGTQYAANTPSPPAPGNQAGGGGNILTDHGGSDVLSTPPQPVQRGASGGAGNYGAAYAESDSGPVTPARKSGGNVAAVEDDEPAPKSTKKKSSSSSSGGSTRTYVVKRGDTLSEIAGKYGTTVTKLKSINGLSGSQIMIGQKLKVSGSGAKATATSGKKKSSSSSSSGRYTVKSGDSLWGISQKKGVSVTAIKKANGMSSSTITPGQKLKIP